MAKNVVMALVQGFDTHGMPHLELSFSCRWSHLASWRRDGPSSAGCPSSHSVGCVGTQDHPSQRDVSPDPISDPRMMREKLWRDFFVDPSQWWDHRSGKTNPRYPDFKHKSTGQSLWLHNVMTPPWVAAELATMAPGLIQSHIFSWNVRLRRHLKAKDYKKTLDLFQQMQQEGMMPDKFTFVPVLNACSNLRSLEEGRRVHEQIIRRACESDIYVDNSLIDMYAKCGSIEDACSVFNKMREHNVVSWNVMIVGYVKSEQGLNALELFWKMQQGGVEPNTVTFAGALNACASVAAIEEGRRVHKMIIQRACESDVYVATCLVDMYAKCGSIECARNVFDKMRERNVVCWNAMIGGYVKLEQELEALELWRKMQQEGVESDAVTFVGVLNACASIAFLEEGRRVHEQIIRWGHESNIYVANCLVDMYAKCGSIEDAWSVFDKMRERDVFSWSAIIGSYVKSRQVPKALELFQKMQQEGVEPDAIIFVGVLNACASITALEEGRFVHEQIIRRDCELDVSVANCLVDMYAKCGSIKDAWNVFKRMQERSVVSWNAMIGGYVKSNQGLKALELYRKMHQEGVEPNTVTFVGVLNACSSVATLEDGRHVHEQIICRGCESNGYVANCLVDMYSKLGSIQDAWNVFNRMWKRDVVSWTAMIVGYVKSGEGLKALELFQKMQQEGVEPDTITFVGALNACASLAALDDGKHLHEQIIWRGFQSNIYVANCLVDMYAKCGSIEDAWSVFKRMRERSVVSWNVMIAGYVKSGQGLKALELFGQMQQGVEPDIFTFMGVLNACASVAALEEGKRVHEQIIRKGCEFNVCIANCLVDMYAKCGSIKDAWSVFKRMQERDVVSWTAMIMTYVKFNQGPKALELFWKMQQERVEPNTVTFVGALNACASIAALEEGRRLHELIIWRGCESDIYVANCLVDMYAKCGSIEDAWTVFNKIQKRDLVSWSAMIVGYVKSEQGLKALELFGKMQEEGVEPDAITFVGMLNACASIAALKEGRNLHEQIIQRGCESDVYVANSLIDMYAKCGSLEDARSLFNKMPERDVVSWSAMMGGYAMHGHSKKAVGLIKQMGKEGLAINQVTFTCLLSACSHGGLVKEGLRYFNTMTACYNVSPTWEHNACTVDLLGRAGRLMEAEEMIRSMPMTRNSFVWMSFLSACRIHGNIEMAEWASKRCWEMDPENASAHVLLSNIYAAGKLDKNATISN